MRILLFFTVIFIFLISVCYVSEEIDSFYLNHQDAVDDNAFVRGWIPDFIPASSGEIHEAHNIDTNEVWLNFHVSDIDSDFLEIICNEACQEMIIFPRKAIGIWWPEDLVQKSEHGPRRIDRYRYFICPDGWGAGVLERGGEGNPVFYMWRPVGPTGASSER
jgi:hypothetical protein